MLKFSSNTCNECESTARRNGSRRCRFSNADKSVVVCSQLMLSVCSRDEPNTLIDSEYETSALYLLMYYAQVPDSS
jgi:hypothetical protein